MRISDFLSGYLPRLPFFLFIYSLLFVLIMNDSIFYLLSLLAVFSFVYFLDFIIPKKWVFAIISLLISMTRLVGVPP